MKELIMIIGLPGSGKTNMIQNKYHCDDYFVRDDVQGGAVLNKGGFTYSNHYPEIISEIKKGEKNIVISDIRYCNYADYRETVEILSWWIRKNCLKYNLLTYAYENDPEKCKINVINANRSDTEDRIKEIDKYSPLYKISDYKDAAILPVYF